MARAPLIRQGEGPLAAMVREHMERTEAARKVARILLEVGGRDEQALSELEARLPSKRQAPLLLMDRQVRRGFPFRSPPRRPRIGAERARRQLEEPAELKPVVLRCARCGWSRDDVPASEARAVFAEHRTGCQPGPTQAAAPAPVAQAAPARPSRQNGSQRVNASLREAEAACYPLDAAELEAWCSSLNGVSEAPELRSWAAAVDLAVAHGIDPRLAIVRLLQHVAELEAAASSDFHAGTMTT